MLVNGSPNKTEIEVVQGKTIRLRLLNSCRSSVVDFLFVVEVSFLFSPTPFVVSVDNHAMSIVAMDGKSVAAKSVTSFLLLTGQRMDVTINADQPLGIYWLRASAYHHHGKMAGMKGKTGTMAIRYKVIF